MKKDKIENMPLPLVNPNEELETTSRIRLERLLEGSELELRPDPKDKGIDFSLEVKKFGKHTNFRSLVQLKATANIEANTDGSFSLQVETSNINYLLNSGLHAYYILYHVKTEQFYYVHLNDFILSLQDSSLDWQLQKTHTLCFSATLDQQAITGIYNTTYNSGVLRNNINESLTVNLASSSINDRVLIDKDLNVLSDAGIREMIEVAGISLINEGKWQEVITLHKKASQKVNTTPVYNLILGVASYYQGQMVEALMFFKYASQGKDQLNPEQQNLLDYFDAAVKYSMGILSKSAYDAKTNDLEGTSIVGLYIKIEQAKRRYLTADPDLFEESFRIFEADISQIINDPAADSNIGLLARCELVLVEGNRNIIRFQQGVARLNALEIQLGQPSLQARRESAEKFMSASQGWYKKVADLKTDALQKKNYLAYCNALLNEVRVQYEMSVSAKLFTVSGGVPGQQPPSAPDLTKHFKDMRTKLDTALKYYELVSYLENRIVALSLQYELLHFLDEPTEAKKAITEATNLASEYDNPEFVEKISSLKNEGTTHEKLRTWMDGIFAEAESARNDYNQLREEMIRMDEAEETLNLHLPGGTIDLFPIGYFSVPHSGIETVCDILHITDSQVRLQYRDRFASGIIPIANILNDPIDEEGPGTGYAADQGLESWRNVYRVRKAFYENKFYRHRGSMRPNYSL